jgi:hypothetical protein
MAVVSMTDKEFPRLDVLLAVNGTPALLTTQVWVAGSSWQ